MANILAVDDTAPFRQMVAIMLKSAGHEVTEAADGRAALDIARTQEFELVLSDLDMPHMDGLALTRELRSLPNYKSTPILMLSSESGVDKIRDGKAAGANEWIVKPFKMAKFLAIIKKFVG